ncbi:hypothetical protein E3N88_12146 [Mikania micrantha]|uniref:Reverse transcriptase Ty1/copia-type domain-containing protein n=1 Tax=Mikania micrantha TaxID=192012 RepID=A0A5N6P607_9ASTR|nr:hypothetical protein E3N88_12146 [Mikania micrantha]
MVVYSNHKTIPMVVMVDDSKGEREGRVGQRVVPQINVELIVNRTSDIQQQGYCQEEGIDYDETFTHVARLEAMRLFLAFAISHNIKEFQMDIKISFLYGTIKEEVYVCQPPGFDDVHHPDWVYRLDKALYGLKQAPRAWYDTLSQFLLSNKFSRGAIDKTLFIKRVDKELLLVQLYVDNIIFGSTKPSCVNNFLN